MVSGKPGTVIKEPNGNVVGTIGSDGSTKIDLQRNPHYAFLLSSDSVQGIDVPFALEYQPNTKKKAAAWVGTGLSFVAPPLFGYLIYGVHCALHLYDADVEHCYEYIPVQTNEDLNIN